MEERRELGKERRKDEIKEEQKECEDRKGEGGVK